MHDPFLYPDFTSYIRLGEPSQRRRAENWAIAIGLQAVDGLRTSEYLHQVAKRNIEGEVEMGEVPHILRSYYQVQAQRESEYEQEEADKASANIAHLLSQPTLDFTVHGYLTVHRRIFEGVLKHAGRVRDYNITKEEWVLRGDTVSYLAHQDIMPALHYEIEQERSFDYAGLGLREVVAHLARFVASLWQVHAFCEGNTRTTAVFLIQYLRSIGFEVSNALFAQHSWFFRNALVRANYKQVQLGISYEYAPLERFFQNLLMGEQHRLSNRQLLIAPPENWPRATEQVPNKYRTSTEQVPNKSKLPADSVCRLVLALGEEALSVRVLMGKLALRHRPSFLSSYLKVALSEGYIAPRYPDSPRHPRQQYLLTVKGKALFQDLKSRDT